MHQRFLRLFVRFASNRLYLPLASVFSLILLFQNCSQGFKAANLASLASAGTSFCQASPNDALCIQAHIATCSFNGVDIPEGGAVTAFLQSTGECQAQTRKCTHGVLDGSYAYSSCQSSVAASCLFNGQTIASGAHVVGYLNSTATASTACQSQDRVCQNGVLSGSFSFATCADSPSANASCLFNGQTISHGSTVSAYPSSTVPSGQSCAPVNRTCFNGALTGSGNFASCTVNSAQSCLFNGQTIPSGQSIQSYASSSVSSGQVCAATQRTCSDGVLSSGGDYASCEVNQPRSCAINSQTIPDGGSSTFYVSNVVPQGGQCTTENRSCVDGTLSGSASATSCTVLKRTDYGPFSLKAGESLTSGNLKLSLQTDGNFVLYRTDAAGVHALWNSQTANRQCGSNCVAGFQSDGNLVLYQGGTAYWDSRTSGLPGARLVLSSRPPYVSVRSPEGRTVWGSGSDLHWLTALPVAHGFNGAADYQELFSNPSSWTRAASHINVIKIYLWHFISMSDADLAQVIQFLDAHDMSLAVEFGAVADQPGCGNEEGYTGSYPDSSVDALSSKIQRLGGELAYVAMDEPLYFGHYPIDANAAAGQRSCRLSIPDLAQNVAGTLASFRRYFPAVQAGDIEPFFQIPSSNWANEFSQWIDAFAAANGAPLAFFHDDAIFSSGNWSTMIPTMQNLLKAKSVPYGFIVNGTQLSTDAQWVTAARTRTQTYRALGLPTPDQVIVQTWDQYPRHVVPETSDTSLISVVNFYFESPLVDAGGPASLYRLHNLNAGWLYTTNPSELSSATATGSWKFDATAAYIYPTAASLPGLVPMHRLYSAGNNDHYYTCDENDTRYALSIGYRDEGIAGYALPASDPRGVPLWVSMNPRGDHFFSSNQSEAQGIGNAVGASCSTIAF